MAGWYERKILPHIIRCGCGCQQLVEKRRDIVPHAVGSVLEIGMGAGANLPFYDCGKVSIVVGVEPSPELRAIAASAARAQQVDVRLVDGHAEALPFRSETFDSVVCTFTLCTVADPDRALAEARRVLKKDGAFLFCEHGLAPDPGIARWQRRIEPAWKRVFGGCHLTRPVRQALTRHFDVERWEGGFQPKTPRIAGWMEWGCARA